MTNGTKLDRGFTLLELMVAFTIMALMAGMVFSSLRMAMNSYDKSQVRIEEEAVKRILLDYAKRQIGSLFPATPSFQDINQLRSEGMDPFNAPQNLMAGLGGQNPLVPRSLNQIPLFAGEQQSMTFVTVAPLILHENPGLTVVRYGLANDEYGNMYLGLMENRYTGYESFMQMAGNPEGKPLPIVEGIEDVVFEYYGFDPQTQIFEWFETWNGDQMMSVPFAVRISYEGGRIVVPINASAMSGSGRRRNTRSIIPMGDQ